MTPQEETTAHIQKTICDIEALIRWYEKAATLTNKKTILEDFELVPYKVEEANFDARDFIIEAQHLLFGLPYNINSPSITKLKHIFNLYKGVSTYSGFPKILLMLSKREKQLEAEKAQK